MISNQELLRYGTVTKFGLIPTEYGTRSSVITSYFKVNKCERCKLESEHHSGACYLSLPDLVVNASCRPSLCTKPRSTPKIYTIIYHWTRQSITIHLVIWIETDG